MYKKICTLLVIVLLFSCTFNKSAEKPMKKVITAALDNAMAQAVLMAEKYKDQDSLLPRSFIDGKMTTSDKYWWCSGFFPGVLWYLYEYSNDPELLNFAREYTERLEDVKNYTGNHDNGFRLFCSYGNGLRLTGNPAYKEVLLTGAGSLCTRYRENVGLIRSWDFNQEVWQYPVIIDNMMNLELIVWAAKESGDERFLKIATSHADKTMENHFRPDGSSYHVVSYDTISGLPMVKQTWQGAGDESDWSRGQAWGLYGYVMMFRETGNQRYLEQAIKIAGYLINHPNMPEDYIPYWDLKAPGIPGELRDASAAAIIASALIDLSKYTSEDLAEKYLKVAEKQIRTLASTDYTAPVGENGNFILMHSVGSMPGKSEVDVPLTYTDYYFIEALMRYKKMKNL